MPYRNKIISNINSKWHNLKYSHFLGLQYAQSIVLPHNVITPKIQQEENEIQQEMINGHYRIRISHEHAYHVEAR